VRVGFDARCLQTASSGGGVGRYARGLLAHLPAALGDDGEELIVYISARRAEPRMPPAARIVRLWRPARAITFWDQIFWPLRMRRDRLALFHSPFYGIPVRRPRGIAVVATVHDIIPELFPESVTRKQRFVFRRHFRQALAANRIIVPSERTRGDLVARFAADPRRIEVIPLGLDPDLHRPDRGDVTDLRGRLTAGRPYILHVGGFDRMKDLPSLLAAFGRIAAGRPGLALVVCGDARGPAAREFAESVRRAGLVGRVVLPGRIVDAELPAVYAAAEAFVFPSRYEGFGLPPLEAMACGCPVVASSGGSLGEVLGEAAHLVSAMDTTALAAAIERVLDDEVLRRRLVAAGRERVKELRWEEAARRTAAVYADAGREAREGQGAGHGGGAGDRGE